MAILLLGSGIGIGIGIGRWQIQRAGETARPSTGHQQQSAGNTIASSDGPTKIKRSTNNGEAPAATAKRLLDAMVQNNLGNAEDPVGRSQFQQAVAQCDEATLSELMEEMRLFAAQQIFFFIDNHEALEWCRLMVERMAIVAPIKAIEEILDFEASSPSGPEDLELIFANLYLQDPAQIPVALAKMEAKGCRSEGERAWMLTQAKTDPEAVFQYLIKNEASIDDKDLEVIARRLGQYAPEKAIAAICHYGDTGDVDEILSPAMHTWLKRDPAAANAYAMKQKDASLILLCTIDTNFGLDYSALRQIYSELTSTTPGDRALLAIPLAANLAEQDVAAARQWAATLLPEEQEKVNVAIAEKWISKDPEAASEWLATWPEGEDKADVVGILINKIKDDDPERAITWATSCLQGQARYIKLAGIMETLESKDPNAAAAARAALSEEDRRLLKFTEMNASGDPYAASP